MNRKQIVTMWLGIMIFILFGLFTRTQFTKKNISRDSGKIIFEPDSYVVDYGPLAARLGSTVLVTVALIYSFKDKNTAKNEGSKHF